MNIEPTELSLLKNKQKARNDDVDYVEPEYSFKNFVHHIKKYFMDDFASEGYIENHQE